MGAVLVEEGEIVGTCSLPICLCVEHNSKPQGCLNFRPQTTPTEKSMGLHTQVSDTIEGWLRSAGLPHSVPASLVSGIIAAVKQAVPVVMVEEAVPDRYCVIATEALDRNWQPSIDGAVAHARTLFAKSDRVARSNRRESTLKKLILVKAINIIEAPPPVLPPVVVRPPTNADFRERNNGRESDDEGLT